MTASRHAGLDLLPPNAPALERALSRVSAELRDLIPWNDLAACFDPERCPERLLPWLATVYSVDIWFERWPVTRKREVIARAVELHRLKGTLAGIEAYLGLVDADLVAARTPPDMFWLDEHDGAGRAAWLARLPQVQIRHWIRTGEREQAGALDDQPFWLGPEDETTGALETFLDDDEPNTAIAALFCLEAKGERLTGATAVLVEGAVETELGIEATGEAGSRTGIVSEIERLFVPDGADPFVFLSLDDARSDTDPSVIGEPADGGGFLAGDARRYVALIRRGRSTVADFAGPTVLGRDVVDADPVRLYPESPAPTTLFLDECSGDLDETGEREALGYLAEENEVLTAYVDTWRLVDPDVPEAAGPAFSFLGIDRLGLPAYEAEIAVDRQEPSHPLALFLGDVPAEDDGLGFLIEVNLAAFDEICSAVDTAKSRRDRILVDFNMRMPKGLRAMTSLRELFG